ncbi:MAG: helix-turn-helix domain-containing protein [Bacillota bacterium]|nr:helix-turn-helix domain-containing protein [Bacillota bacterium]
MTGKTTNPGAGSREAGAATALLVAMYVQFLDFVCRRKAALVCRHCEKWFAPKKRGTEFCFTSCRAASFYYTRKKPALEMHKAGVPTSDIATRLGVSEDRVAGWVKETG